MYLPIQGYKLCEIKSYKTYEDSTSPRYTCFRRYWSCLGLCRLEMTGMIVN